MSEIRFPVRYDHSSSLLIEADGGPIADCLTNHEIGEQIAAALNATLTEQLAEAQESLHKADGMANEINILVNENRALQAKVERLEAMLEKAVYIEFGQWAIYNNYPFAGKPGDGKIRLFKKNETNQSFDVREFDSVLEAYEARETFEATQDDSNGRGTQET